ncbi:MAG: YbaN family protein [Planctomycetota bacterium]|jgi:uncharacterized membrane protein YbaN (DUF454 family)
MSRAARYALAGLGVLSVGVGTLGIFVPGLPTTVFLIFASWCFARSCPWLEERLLRHRIFRPYLRLLEGGRPLAARTRAVALLLMWGAIGTSLWMLRAREALPAWAATAFVLAGAIGTVAIFRYGKRRAAPKPL